MAGVCMGYVSKKSWRAYWNVSGKQFFKMLPKSEYLTRRQAYQEAVRLESEGESTSSKKMSFVEFYQTVFLKNRIIKEGSKSSYKAMLQRFEPFIQEKGLELIGQFSEEVVIEYLNDSSKKIPKGHETPYSPKTLNRDRDYLNLIFEMAKRKGHLKKWERKEIQKLSEEKLKRMPDYANYPSKKERSDIARWILKHEPFYFAWVHFNAKYGWRRDEVRKLKWPDINFDKRIMKLLATKEKQREASLDDEDLTVLNEHMLIAKKKEKYDPAGYVFPNLASKRKAGTPGIICKNNLYKAIQRACEDLGIQKHITPHTFRHAVTSELKHSGRYSDLEIIQITGHSDVDSLKFYAHPFNDSIGEMTKELSLGVLPKVRDNEKTMQ